MSDLKPQQPNESVLAETLHLALPATLAMLSQWAVGLMDTYMVGRLANGATAQRGIEAIANVHIGGICFLALAINWQALSTGTQAVAARRWGEGNFTLASRVLSMATLLALAVSAVALPVYFIFGDGLVNLFAHGTDAFNPSRVIGYLNVRFWAIPSMLVLFAMRGWFNGVGNTKVAMISVVLVNVLNLAMNWLFIEGRMGFPRMEEWGAGLASTVSSYVGVAYILIYCFVARRYRDLRLLRQGKIEPTLIGRIIRLSAPPFVQFTLVHLGFTLFIAGIVPRTKEGLLAVAASGIVWSVTSVTFFVSAGFGVAAATMLGHAMGSGDLDNAERKVWTAARVGWLTCLALAVCYVLFARQIAGLFTSDQGVIDIAFWLFVIVALFQLIDNFGIVLSIAFQGAGMTLFVMATEVPVNVVLFIVLAWVFGVYLDWGVIGAWSAMIVYASVFSVIMIIAFRRGLWRRGRA